MEFSTILIDPPWKEHGGGKSPRGAQHKYKTMSVKDIIRTVWTCPVFRPAKDCHLYLCATNTFLIQAGANVMPQWGFRYVTDLTWFKDAQSLGQYFRGETEQILFGVRGKGYTVKTDRKDLGTAIVAPCPRYPKGHEKYGQRIHSRKPEELYRRIEARSKGPYLEIFATVRRDGWESWGDKLE